MKKAVEKFAYFFLLTADVLFVLIMMLAMYATLRHQNISVGLNNPAWYAFNSYTEILFYGAFFVSAVLSIYAGTIMLHRKNRLGYLPLVLPIVIFMFFWMG